MINLIKNDDYVYIRFALARHTPYTHTHPENVTPSYFGTHIPHLKDLHWLPIPYRIDYKVAVLAFRCLNGCAPSYLSSLLHRRSNNSGGRVLRSTNAPSASHDLVLPPIHLKTYGKRAFSSYAPAIWNALLVTVRSSNTLPSFRSALKRHYFQDAFLSQFPRYNWESLYAPLNIVLYGKGAI